MKVRSLTAKDRKRIAKALLRFDAEHKSFIWLTKTASTLLAEHPKLQPLIHSIKWRVKDRSHLERKLIRFTLRDQDPQKPLDEPITADNLFEKIEDLAGVRILHLNTSQFKQINRVLLEILKGQQWVVNGPEASTWDDEYRAFFTGMGVTTIPRNSLYTSVHYVIKPNSKDPLKCELQVRTLAEEIWGEVSHTIDYPEPTKSIACKEQLKALARLTSSCTRLVDSIFESEMEHRELLNKT